LGIGFEAEAYLAGTSATESRMRAFLLVFALSPLLANASPAVRMLDPSQVSGHTDVVAQLDILKRTVSTLKNERVTVIEARVKTAKGRKALPIGTLIRFEKRCTLNTPPMDPWRSAYPNNRCGLGWTALPAGFADANAKTVKAQLIVPGDGTISVTPTTTPVTASLRGRIVTPK
jgi:hypothetical protein